MSINKKRFNTLVRAKNLSLEDLFVIFQAINIKDSGRQSDIRRISSVTEEKIIMLTVLKGANTEESPILEAKQWWTKNGEYIGETL